MLLTCPMCGKELGYGPIELQAPCEDCEKCIGEKRTVAVGQTTTFTLPDYAGPTAEKDFVF